MALSRRVGTVAALGSAQTLAWASSYYLPAMLAAPIAKELGISTPTVFAAFSLALIVSARSPPFDDRARGWRAPSSQSGTSHRGCLELGLSGLSQEHV